MKKRRGFVSKYDRHHDEIVAKIKAGATKTELIKAYGGNHKTIVRFAKRNGLTVRLGRKPSNPTVENSSKRRCSYPGCKKPVAPGCYFLCKEHKGFDNPEAEWTSIGYSSCY